MIEIIPSEANQIWQRAADLLFEKINKENGKGKKIFLLLSGGSALSIYQELANKIQNIEIRPGNVAIGQLDERFRPDSETDINSLAIEKTGLIEILKNKEVPFYKIPQTGTFREAAFNYDKLLTKLFLSFDYKMAVLGIGKDGHIAGLLRSYKNEWDKDRMVVGYENRGEYKWRISITPGVFRILDYGIVAVSGVEKKEMAARILENESEDVNNLPGILIHKIKEVDLLKDF